ncbi:hypothetical protein EDB84DRAFT_1646513, partial [Lactarius hengduanensis]
KISLAFCLGPRSGFPRFCVSFFLCVSDFIFLVRLFFNMGGDGTWSDWSLHSPLPLYPASTSPPLRNFLLLLLTAGVTKSSLALHLKDNLECGGVEVTAKLLRLGESEDEKKKKELTTRRWQWVLCAHGCYFKRSYTSSRRQWDRVEGELVLSFRGLATTPRNERGDCHPRSNHRLRPGEAKPLPTTGTPVAFQSSPAAKSCRYLKGRRCRDIVIQQNCVFRRKKTAFLGRKIAC